MVFFIFPFFTRSFLYGPNPFRNGFSDFDRKNNNTPLSHATTNTGKSIDINRYINHTVDRINVLTFDVEYSSTSISILRSTMIKNTTHVVK